MIALMIRMLWRLLTAVSQSSDMVLFSRLSHSLMAAADAAVKAVAFISVIDLAFRHSIGQKKNGRRFPQSPNQLQCHVPKNKTLRERQPFIFNHVVAWIIRLMIYGHKKCPSYNEQLTAALRYGQP
jgi:hypothetical protein